MAESALDVFAPVLPITERVMREMPSLFLQYPALTARDLIHVATCRIHGIEELWSADRDFSRFPGVAVRNPLVA